MWLQREEDVQTLEGQVPQEIHCVAGDKWGGKLGKSSLLAQAQCMVYPAEAARDMSRHSGA